MNEKELLKKLLELGIKMRRLQKSYFRERDIRMKQEFLQASKKAEAEFDSALLTLNRLLN